MKTPRVFRLFKQRDEDRGKSLNRRFTTYIICCLFALSFWLLLALSRNYESRVQFEIDYQNLPADKALLVTLPHSFNITLNGKGFDLAGLQFGRPKLPVQINIESNSIIRHSDGSMEYRLPSKSLIPDFNKIIGSDLEIVAIDPDTLHLSFTDIQLKRVPVHPELKISFSKPYDMKGDYKIFPDSLTVSGPQSQVDLIKEIKTEPVEISNLDRPLSKILDIEKIKTSNVSYSADKIYLTVQVEEYTESSMTIPLQVQGVRPELQVRVLPEHVTVSYRVSLPDFSRVTPEMFTALADFSEFEPGVTNKIRVQLTKIPYFVKSVSVSPSMVSYILVK